MASDLDILNQFAKVIVPELQAVSGRFAESIKAETTPKSLTITASPYINTLIDGRPPTRDGATKGSPTLQQILKEWINTKGITPQARNGRVPSIESLSWAMSKSIHTYGDLLWQRGGGNNIFDGIITESRINSLLNSFSEKYYNEIKTINLPNFNK